MRRRMSGVRYPLLGQRRRRRRRPWKRAAGSAAWEDLVGWS
jgi:hypothetical protein